MNDYDDDNRYFRWCGPLQVFDISTDPIRSWGSLTEPMQPKYYLKKHLL